MHQDKYGCWQLLLLCCLSHPVIAQNFLGELELEADATGLLDAQELLPLHDYIPHYDDPSTLLGAIEFGLNVHSNYRLIDEYVLKTPTWVTGSITDLAAYLIKSAHNDFEKTRAIFRWVAHAVSYDTDSYFSLGMLFT